MNINNDKNPINQSIADALKKLNEGGDNVKDGVDLTDIAKKLSSKKFGKKK